MQPGGDMSALLAQAQQMQQKLLQAQQQLANAEVRGEAGGGLVKVVVKGSGEVIAVKIDPKVVDPGDIDASRQVTAMAQERLGSLAGGLGAPPARPEPPTQMPQL